MKYANDTYVIQERVTNGSLINYCYFCVNSSSRQAVAIDPAWEIDTLKRTIDKHKISISGVLLTHHHADHIDLSQVFANYFDCKIYISKAEYDFYKISLNRVVLLEDESIIDLKGLSINPIFTPGHTIGSTCFLINDSLFTGDTLFIEGTGMCSTLGGNPYSMYRSLKKIKNLISDDVRIYPGHRFYKDIGATFSTVKESNIYLQINNVDHFVKFRMRESKNKFSFS